VEKTLFSIITVVYNNEEHIGDAIQSVLSQDYDAIEYVVIDGGSTDRTLDIIHEYRDRISVVVSEPDAGIYDALNKGIGLATGQVIGFLHSDDLFAHCGVISSLASKFSETGADAVYGDLDYVQKMNSGSVVRHWRSGEFSPRKLKHGWMPPHPSFYARREVYSRLGGFDLSYRIAADYDCMLRILTDESISAAYLPEVLVKMRTGGVSNRGLLNIARKSREDYRALRSNGVGGIWALLWKNLGKLPQFVVRG